MPSQRAGPGGTIWVGPCENHLRAARAGSGGERDALAVCVLAVRAGLAAAAMGRVTTSMFPDQWAQWCHLHAPMYVSSVILHAERRRGG